MNVQLGIHFKDYQGTSVNEFGEFIFRTTKLLFELKLEKCIVC